MADTSSVKTVRALVDELLMKTKVDRNENFFLYAKLAQDIIRDLYLFHLNTSVAVKCTPDSLGRVSMPSDCTNVVGVYTFLNGKMTSLTREDRIITTTTGTAPNETQDSAQGEGVTIGMPFVAGYMASGGKNIDGYYKVAERDRVIWLNGVTRTEVILVYVSNGMGASDMNVPVKAIAAIEMGILSKVHTFQPSKLSEFYERKYDIEVEKLRVLEQPSLDEIQDVWNYYNSPLIHR